MLRKLTRLSNTGRVFKCVQVIVLITVASFPLIANSQDASGPAVGTDVADFKLSDQHGEIRKLSEILSNGPVALVVLRSAGWCGKSKEQLIQLQSELEAIQESGLQVVGLSFDQAQVLKDFADLKGVKLPLLSDPKSKVIEQLGLINRSRKKGTIRYRVAHPLTILINSDGAVADVVGADKAGELHGAKQLIDAWNEVKPPELESENKTSFIKVHKNKFVDEDGTQVFFKGLAIADPDKIVRDGHWNKKHFETIKSWGANLIRIPVHPPSLRKRGLENYLKLLDEAVEWCDELEMYVIIDWHSIGNLRTRKFESPHCATSKKETMEFWRVVSKRFANNPTIAFYEVFNEPTTDFGDLGDCTWEQWKEIVESIIDVIYANDPNVIPLVSGFDWAYDLREVESNPIERPGVAYVAHPYPIKCKPPREPHWEEHFGFLKDRFPVFVTETGFSVKGESKYMVDDGTFRNAILKYLDKKEISWCAWVFDPDWELSLIKSYDYQPTRSGQFFKDAMLEK